MMDIATLLDELAELQAQADLLCIDKQKAIDAAIPEEVKARLNEIEAEYADPLTFASEKATDLESRIKTATVALGETVKGTRLQAVFNTRTSWDNKGLMGFAAAHPEIERFQKTSTFVSIRRINGK